MRDGLRPGRLIGQRRVFATVTVALSLACAGPSEPDRRALTMDIAPELVACQGFVAQECLRVSLGPGGPWTLFYESIEGFAFEPGFEYTIRVERRTVRPLQDGSRFTYRLLEVIRKVPVIASQP